MGLKPYERVYVNDPEMQMGTDAEKTLNTMFILYGKVQLLQEQLFPAEAAVATN